MSKNAINIPKKTPPKKHKKKPVKDIGFSLEEPVFAAPSPVKLRPKAAVKPEVHNDFEFEDLFAHSAADEKRATQADGGDMAGTPHLLLAPHIDDEKDDDDADEEGCILPITSKMSLDRLQLLKVVGQGGYGKVLQVRRKDNGEIYAMKVLKKEFLVRTNNVEYTKAEKDVLKKIRHPFIVALHYTFQNESKVYLVMDFINGGQLLFHLRTQAMFSQDMVRFYAAEIVLALEHLHGMGVIHRDLKPENILLDSAGHVVLTDFGFAKDILADGRARTFCGTMEYMSPEMIKGAGYGKATDWWSLGILIFDMLTGEPPFRSKNEGTLQQKIVNEKLRIPAYLTAESHKIIKDFVNRDEKARLGSSEDSIAKIKAHPFFRGIDWRKLLHKEVDPPFRPEVSQGSLDTNNFDEEFLGMPVTETPTSNMVRLTSSQEKLFQGFSWVRSATPDHHLDMPPRVSSASPSL